MLSDNLLLLESFFMEECKDRLPKFIYALQNGDDKTCEAIFAVQCMYVAATGPSASPELESFKKLIKLDTKRIINKLRLFRADCSMLAYSPPGDDD